MSLSRKPIYLFADSQLLFSNQDGGWRLSSVLEFIDRESPRAAYIGASNNDTPAFYSIFLHAMGVIGIENVRMIASAFPPEDALFVNDADLILLAGGEIERGWRVFVSTGLREIILKRYIDGAVLIGVSAGAVQLGLLGRSNETLFDTFKLVPFVVSVHEERQNWSSLRDAIRSTKRGVTGIGIPSGGGARYSADGSLQAIRYALHEFSCDGTQFNHSLRPPAAE